MSNTMMKDRCTGTSNGGYLCTKDRGHDGPCRGLESVFAHSVERVAPTLKLKIALEDSKDDRQVMERVAAALTALEDDGAVLDWKWSREIHRLPA